MRCILPVAYLIAAPVAVAQHEDTGRRVEPPRPRVAWKYPLNSDAFGGPSVADADGDGHLDAAIATYFGDSRFVVLRGKDGSLLWQHDAGTTPGAGDACLDASSRFADLDGDGSLELIVPVSNRGEVLALSGTSGDVIWRNTTDPIECTDTPPWIGDLDGSLSIVIGTFHGNARVLGADGSTRRSIKAAPSFVQSCPVVRDVNADGVPDFIVADFKGRNRLYAVCGATGEHLWTHQARDSMYHGPSVGDFDGDGIPELVIADYSGTVHAMRSSDGTPVWTARPGDHYFMSPTVIADLDADGSPEVIVASVNVTALRADGSILWSVPVDPATGVMNSVTRGVSVADIDGDGSLDIALVNSRGLLRVMRGHDGSPIFEFDAASITDFTPAHSSSGVSIADLTGDGRLDLLFVAGNARAKRGMVICLTGFAGPAVADDGRDLGWFMLRHDPSNTGNVSTALPWPPRRAAEQP